MKTTGKTNTVLLLSDKSGVSSGRQSRRAMARRQRLALMEIASQYNQKNNFSRSKHKNLTN
jgi:hypothetical protein